MEGHRLACLLPLLLKELQAAVPEQRSAAAGHLAAGMQAGPAAEAVHMPAADKLEQAAGMTAVQEHPVTDMCPVLQGCLTSCRGAVGCQR